MLGPTPFTGVDYFGPYQIKRSKQKPNSVSVHQMSTQTISFHERRDRDRDITSMDLIDEKQV